MRSQSEIIVRYAETDQMGVAHHANYPIWYEVARTDLIKKMGMTYSEMEAAGILVPMLEMNCCYHGPAYYEDVLTVEAQVTKVSQVKLEFSYEIYKKGEEKPIHTGRSLHALVGSDMKPLRLKKSHPDIYQMLEDALESC